MAQLIPFPRRPEKEPLSPELHRAELQAEDRRRMLENAAAFVFIVAFLMLSFWVIERVSAYSQNVSCLQFKQRACR